MEDWAKSTCGTVNIRDVQLSFCYFLRRADGIYDFIIVFLSSSLSSVRCQNISAGELMHDFRLDWHADMTSSSCIRVVRRSDVTRYWIGSPFAGWLVLPLCVWENYLSGLCSDIVSSSILKLCSSCNLRNSNSIYYVVSINEQEVACRRYEERTKFTFKNSWTVLQQSSCF